VATYDNKQFTEKALVAYANSLRNRLPRVKFLLDNGGAIKRAIQDNVFRLIGSYEKPSLDFPLDGHMGPDGSLDVDRLVEAVATALSEPLITAAKSELQSEGDDPIERTGAGQLWVLHKTIPVQDTLGAAAVHFAESDGIGLLVQTWYDMNALENRLMARAEWGLLRLGETKKTALSRFEQSLDQ